jgi:hypothetical protein
LELVVRELLNPRPAPEQLVTGRLRKALQLSRMALFELDSTIMAYVNQAHTAVLANMWRHRQPAAAVSLARYALGNALLTEIHDEQGECRRHPKARSIRQRVICVNTCFLWRTAASLMRRLDALPCRSDCDGVFSRCRACMIRPCNPEAANTYLYLALLLSSRAFALPVIA